MGATLNVAIGAGAYTLAEKGTWLAFGNKGRHEILIEGENALINPYGFLLLNLNRYPKIKYEKARLLRDWLRSAKGQAAITSFQIEGTQPFKGHADPFPEEAAVR